MSTNAGLSLKEDALAILRELGVAEDAIAAGNRSVRSPITGELLAEVHEAPADAVSEAVASAHRAFLEWRDVPAPHRRELVRIFAGVLRDNKAHLGRLISIEVGKIASEGLGEVQEMFGDTSVNLRQRL